MDAIAEVYARSTGPIPCNTGQTGIFDFHEEMGIMIQELVGVRIGLLSALCAGVAFSNNELRWSPRVKRKMVVRMVMGFELGRGPVER